MEQELIIDRLSSGGLITNYFCTSRCRHCLYRSSPSWPKDYIADQTARNNFAVIRELGCEMIHIGGGEPLLNPDRLYRVLEIAVEEEIGIEYVETNSSWYKNNDSAVEILENLYSRGIRNLLVSISPMHNEFIPFHKVKGVIKACRQVGMSIFPWIREFYPELDSFNDRRTHSLEEYQDAFGSDYILKLPQRYWIANGGRALEMLAPFKSQKSINTIADENAACLELSETGHFHLDLFGNYIPGLCTGLSIKREDLGAPLDKNDYPIITTLYNDGIGGLVEYAQSHYDIEPTRLTYGHRCELCYEIRRCMVMDKGIDSHELQPTDHYC